MICQECNGTGKAPCEFCSGSGCAYCREDKASIESPEIAEDRKSFTPVEVNEFKFDDQESAQIMADYLNRRCSCNQSCPLIGSVCLTDCVSFQKAKVAAYKDKYRIYDFCCDNPMLIRPYA